MILDASVAVKWFFPEIDTEIAERVGRRQDLAAPSVILTEVGHVLTKRVRQQIMGERQAFEHWRDFTAANIRIAPLGPLARATFDLALELHATFHDAAYLALAVSVGDRLITADRRFVNCVRSRPTLARHVIALHEF